MKINGVDRSVCTVYFEEKDGKYAGKILDLIGEGYNKEFCVHKPLKMYWMTQVSTNPTKFTGVSVADEEKAELLTYVVKEAEKIGFSLLIS